MSSMRVEVGFFEGSTLLCRAELHITDLREVTELTSPQGDLFEISYHFEYPACPIFIRLMKHGDLVGRSAMRMGVADSDDWESINLANDIDLCFRRRVELDEPLT
jgi:hypothetical protein